MTVTAADFLGDCRRAARWCLVPVSPQPAEAHVEFPQAVLIGPAVS